MTENYDTRVNLIKICNQLFQPQDDYAYLKKLLPASEEKIVEEMKPYLGLCLDILNSLVNRTNTITDPQEILQLIEKTESEIKEKKDYNPNWWEVSRFRGMWYVFNNKQYESAIPHYIDAVNGALYSGAENSRRILREAAALCCTAYEVGIRRVDNKNLKSIIKRFKSQGSALGLYPGWTLEDKDVPEQEIQLNASTFGQYFPAHKMF